MGVSQTIWQGRGQIVKFWMQEVFILIFASFINELFIFHNLFASTANLNIRRGV